MLLPNATLAEPQHFSVVEQLLLAVLTMASIAGFSRRFGAVLRAIFQSKKEAGFHVFPIGRRIRDFVWEVCCQSKVIRQRPLPGLAHAAVFWGFCAFVLVTMNHFATPLGFGFLSPAGRFGRFYYYFAAVFALACAAGIAGLFIRRFVVRPKWLGEKLSYESGVIAFLIFLLMATYLADFFLTNDAPATRPLWWVHTLAILIFLVIIPHTKHLHLVLSPFTVFFSRGGFCRIPPLAGEEDFGLVAGNDLTWLVSLQAYSCVECGRCTEHCPAANTGKLLNPKEIILGLRAYLNALGPRSAEPLLGKYNPQEAPFQCTTCGACEFQCPVGIEHLPIFIGLRRGAVNTGAWTGERGTKLFLTLERGSNSFGMAAAERDKFIEKAGLPIFDGSQEYCLWLGCMGGYEPGSREIVAAFARVMNYLGVSFGVLRKEKCCGDPARRLGNDLLFQQLVEANLQLLAQNKVKKLIAICPHCVRTIQEDWKEYGAPPPIEHHSEFLARFADKLPCPSTIAAVNKESFVSGHGLKPGLSLSKDAGNAEGSKALQTAGRPVERVSESRFVSGHDLSRAEKAANKSGALAPAATPGKPEKIVYHDPCYLGRYRGVYKQPRKIISLAGELVEAPRSHERSFCCGAGGGLNFLGEETGERIGEARAAELIATGATTIATACPFCNSIFRDALAQIGEAAPRLLDIAQLTARGLPKNGTSQEFSAQD